MLARILVGLHGGETLDRALGSDAKGIWSAVGYVVAIGLSFVVPLAAIGIYVLIALVWIVRDKRIEREIKDEHPGGA